MTQNIECNYPLWNILKIIGKRKCNALTQSVLDLHFRRAFDGFAILEPTGIHIMRYVIYYPSQVTTIKLFQKSMCYHILVTNISIPIYKWLEICWLFHGMSLSLSVPYLLTLYETAAPIGLDMIFGKRLGRVSYMAFTACSQMPCGVV